MSVWFNSKLLRRSYKYCDPTAKFSRAAEVVLVIDRAPWSEPVWDVCRSSNKLVQQKPSRWNHRHLRQKQTKSIDIYVICSFCVSDPLMQDGGEKTQTLISWWRLKRNETFLIKPPLNKGNSRRRKWSRRGLQTRRPEGGRGAEAIARNLQFDELADDAKGRRFKKIKEKFHIGHLSCNLDADQQGERSIQQLTTGGAIEILWLRFGKACQTLFKT